MRRGIRGIGAASALVLCAATVGVLGLAPAASAATAYTLTLARTPDRANPVDLSGQTVSGNIYVYTSPEAGVSRVDFYVDDPNRTAAPYHSEGSAPYDIAGGAPTAPTAYDTTKLPDGTHTVTEAVTTTTQTLQVVTDSFTVANSPPAPSGVTALPGDATVGLSWTSGGGTTTGFNVYRGTTAGVSTTGTPQNGTTPLTTTSWSDTGLADGTTYYYVVQAVGAGGRHAEASPVSATPSSSAPPAPAGVTATAGDGVVDLAWTSGGGSTTGFQVYRGTSPTVATSGTPSSGATPLTATTFHDTGLTDGTTYYYVVQAVNGSGGHAEAPAVSAVPAAAPSQQAPSNVAATAGDAVVDLGWTAAPGAAGYNVFRGTSSTVSTTGTPLNGATALTATSFHDAGLTDGTTYYYVVQAVGSAGHAEAPAVAATPAAAAPPAPVGVSARAGDTVVDLSWTTGGGSTTGFTVFRGTTAAVSTSGTPRSGATPLTGTSFHDTGLTDGTTYYYVVQAVNGSGGHAEAPAVSAVPAAATSSYTLALSRSSDRSAPVDLAGATVTGPAYVYTAPATGITRVDFYLDDPNRAAAPYHSETTGPYDLAGGSVTVASPFDTTKLADGGHTLTQAVTTTAKAVQVITDTFRVANSPLAPTGVTPTPGDTVVDLAWSSGGGTTTGFNVFRGTSSAVSTSGLPLNGATPLTSTTFHDTGLTDATTYYYVVQAVDGSSRHAEAAAVSATPVAAPVSGSGAVSVSTRVLFNAGVSATTATQTVSISDVGSGYLHVSGIVLGGADAGQFALSGLPTLPLTLSPHQSTSVQVAFHPTAVGVKGAELDVTTDDPATPTARTAVRGLAISSAGSEPSLQWILDTWQIPVSVGDPDPSTFGLPATEPLGDETQAQLFRKAGSGPVTVTPLGAFAARTTDPAVRYGWTPAGSANAKRELYTVAQSSNQALAVTPTGTTSFDPGSGQFGFYTTFPAAGRTVYQEQDLNPAGGLPRQVRVYPYRTAAGATVAGSYVVATEDYTGPATSTCCDWNDAPVVVSNVTPAGLQVQNPDGLPSDGWFVFNRIGTTLSTSSTYAVHDTGTVRLANSGGNPVTVSAVGVSGPFALGAVSLPATIPAGGSLDVPVTFVATASPAVQTGSVTVSSDDSVTPSLVVPLRGLWQATAGGSAEPNLTSILNSAFGYKTALTYSGQNLDQNGLVAATGDEVLSAFWKRADPSLAIGVRQLAAYHGPGTTSLYTYPRTATGPCLSTSTTTGVCTRLFTQTTTDAQSVLPRMSVGGVLSPAAGTVAGTTSVGFAIGGSENSDDTRNSTTNDVKHGCTGPCGHHVRFWPVKDQNGVLVPNTYLMAEDTGGVNYDYQDNIYLVTNAAPDLP